MLTRDEVLYRSAAAGGRIPLLTLDEFFTGNDAEGSIAPNQEGFGRPTLDEIAARLRQLEADRSVSWVRVQLHEETFEDGADGIEGESVAICTALSDEAVDALLDVDWLQASPVFEGMSYDADRFCDMPWVPEDHRVLTLVWD